MDMAGHVSKRMLKHYSQIRIEAKRRAVAALVPEAAQGDKQNEPAPEVAKSRSKRWTSGENGMMRP
jgi:hypothetical protein